MIIVCFIAISNQFSAISFFGTNFLHTAVCKGVCSFQRHFLRSKRSVCGGLQDCFCLSLHKIMHLMKGGSYESEAHYLPVECDTDPLIFNDKGPKLFT